MHTTWCQACIWHACIGNVHSAIATTKPIGVWTNLQVMLGKPKVWQGKDRNHHEAWHHHVWWWHIQCGPCNLGQGNWKWSNVDVSHMQYPVTRMQSCWWKQHQIMYWKCTWWKILRLVSRTYTRNIMQKTLEHMMSSLANKRNKVCVETSRTCVHNNRPCHEMCWKS